MSRLRSARLASRHGSMAADVGAILAITAAVVLTAIVLPQYSALAIAVAMVCIWWTSAFKRDSAKIRLPAYVRPYAPLKVALAYLVGTFVFFLVIGDAEQVPDMTVLVLFVAATLFALSHGYTSQVHRFVASARENGDSERTVPRQTIAICATYHLLFAVVYLRLLDSNLASFSDALSNPGEAYIGKFAAIENQTANDHPMTILLVLFSVCHVLLVPMSMRYWSRLGLALRGYVLLAISMYVAYFLQIGTLKGPGDIVIFWLATYLVLSRRRARDGIARGYSRRRKVAAIALVLGAFLSYMVYNQGDRLVAYAALSQHPGNSTVASIFGDKVASGLSLAAIYPTHGYLGLAYNLQQPFVWTDGIGSSPAIGSFYAAYLNGDNHFEDRYTARTERQTGWPDGRMWSTVYPWLASDLTFGGAILFMWVVGWFLAKFWLESVLNDRLLSLVLFSQLFLFIAFVPANNQIGLSIYSLAAFLTVSAASMVARLLGYSKPTLEGVSQPYVAQRFKAVRSKPVRIALPTDRERLST
jgi:hypothetical protein